MGNVFMGRVSHRVSAQLLKRHDHETAVPTQAAFASVSLTNRLCFCSKVGNLRGEQRHVG
jgi:hypothetical protein